MSDLILSARVLNLKEAQSIASANGWTLRKYDGEFQMFPKGTGIDAPSACFDSDIESVMSSAFYNFPSSHSAMRRIEESQIARFQLERIAELKARRTRDSRMAGAVGLADLECNAARHCATQGRTGSSPYFMQRAIWHWSHAMELLQIAARNEKGAYWKESQLEQARRIELRRNVDSTYFAQFSD